MDAEQALFISSQKKPIIDSEGYIMEYASIMEDIKRNVNKGRFDMYLSNLPSTYVRERLIHDGYSFYIIGGSGFMPFLGYKISWAEKEEKKKINWQMVFAFIAATLFIIITYLICKN